MFSRLPQAFHDEFLRAASDPHEGTAAAALAFARIEYPRLDPAPYLRWLDDIGRTGRELVEAAARERPERAARVAALTHYVYDELGFTGDREHYDDPRNSFLNVVLERRAGIPISLAVVLMEVAGRAGVAMEGVNFPGHFLVRVPAAAGAAEGEGDLLIDPFHRGAIVSESDCERLLRTHIGEEIEMSPSLFETAGKHEILVRMLLNLKRAYVRLRSFPQARLATELLVALGGNAAEVRDRGLLAYHLDDYACALRDLQEYLCVAPLPETDEGRREHQQIWEHVKALKRRLASLN